MAAGRDSAGARPAATAAVDNGAGLILAFMFWGWVGLPLLQGGPTQVKNVIRAKFINKDAAGSWLP